MPELLGLVVVSLEAFRMDTPSGIIPVRVLFDGTNSIRVNERTRIRDEVRVPSAADLKRFMREKTTHDEHTFALTADVTEAHRHLPMAPCDRYLRGCQAVSGCTVYVVKVGTL